MPGDVEVGNQGTVMQEPREFVGEIVDQQAFLDGTREYTIEAETASDDGAPWRLTLSFRWPKEMESELEEGDLSLADPEGSAVYGTLLDGSAAAVFDEDTADELVRIDLRFEVRSGEGAYAEQQGRVRVEGRLVGDEAWLAVHVTAK